MDVKLLNGWIMVKPDPDATMTQGGLEIPTGSREDVLKKGTVIAVGRGLYTKKGVEIPPDVRVGDRVTYVFALEKCHTNEQIRQDFDGNVFLKEKDVVAVEDPD